MTAGHHDAWAVAVQNNTDVAYSGNTAGNTRNSRIDYVFYSKGATRLKLSEVRVFDTRSSSGVMPSDHRPLMLRGEIGRVQLRETERGPRPALCHPAISLLSSSSCADRRPG
jgi:hypothetical protein